MREVFVREKRGRREEGVRAKRAKLKQYALLNEKQKLILIAFDKLQTNSDERFYQHWDRSVSSERALNSQQQTDERPLDRLLRIELHTKLGIQLRLNAFPRRKLDAIERLNLPDPTASKYGKRSRRRNNRAAVCKSASIETRTATNGNGIGIEYSPECVQPVATVTDSVQIVATDEAIEGDGGKK